nr:aldo/keto reductase [Jiella avicenniae]
MGALAISGRFGKADETESIAAIHAAADAGINWVHTAPSYGTGYGEVVVGRAVRQMPEADRPLVFTTCTWVFDQSDEGNDLAVRTKSLAPESIRKQVDGSLRRLGLDRIDLLQFHWPDYNTPIEESWQTIGELIDEGKVRTAGLSNHPLDLIKRCEAVRHVDALQQPLSLLDRSSNGPYSADGRNSGGLDVLNWAEENGVAVLTYAPLQHGLLAGRYNRDSVREFVDAGDPLRPALYWFKEPTYGQALELVELIRPIAARRNTSVASIAIAWVLQWSAVTGAICGARRPSQLDAPVGALKIELTEEDIEEIGEAILKTGVAAGTPGDGPARPIRKG